MKIKERIKNNQQVIVLTIGYLLVAAISFGLGGMIASKKIPAESLVEQPLPLNNSQNLPLAQSADNCKIKGNINSKGSKIYHIQGGAFYNQTNPEECFETEDQAQAAGFAKSSR
ncbi:MAG: hypothetical protein HY336_02420 [Candidatus Doudnabacteria bacterium]|nr:hypothetical protein [Candidatus Doudnabacteria bacterium]